RRARATPVWRFPAFDGARSGGRPGLKSSALDPQQTEHLITIGRASALPQHFSRIGETHAALAHGFLRGLLQNQYALRVVAEGDVIEYQEGGALADAQPQGADAVSRTGVLFEG